MPEDTLVVAGINGGAPFRIHKGLVTPRSMEAAMVAKRHSLREGLQGLNGLDADTMQMFRQDAIEAAIIAQASTLIYHALCHVDSKLKERSVDEVLDLLSMDQYTDLVQLLNSAEKVEGRAPLASQASANS